MVLELRKLGGSALLMSKVFELIKVGGERACEEQPFYLVLRRRFVSWCLSRIAVGAKIGR